MSGFFDFTSPSDQPGGLQGILASLAKLSDWGAAAGPSRLPVPFGMAANMAHQQGLQNDATQQQLQAGQLGLANDKLGIQQKLAPMNFMRNLQGLPPLSMDDVMKGNYGSLSPTTAPFGVPSAPQPSAPAPITPFQPAPVAAQPQPQPVPNQQPVAPITAIAPSGQTSSLIPPDLASNPLFQAAIQSGDSGTVMSTLTKHQTQLTADELIAANLPPDSLAYKDALGGPIDIKNKGSIQTQAEIDAAVKAEQAKRIKSPKEIQQELDLKRKEAGIQAPSVENQVVLPLMRKVMAGQQLSPEEQAALAIAKPSAPPSPDDPSVALTAKAIANYQQAPLSGFVMKTLWGQAVNAKVYTMNPDYRAQNYNMSNKAQSAFASGPQGNLVRSFNVAIAHLNTLGDLTTALNNKDMQAYNAAANAFKAQFGSSAPTNFNAAKAIVGDEIIKAIVGGGGALADRENAQNQISAANTPAQLAGVIQTYKKLMAGQLTGLKKQYETSTMTKNFDDMLLPETQQELESVSNTPSSVPKPPTVPPPQAIQMLKMNPKLRGDFDAKYGVGAAKAVLGN